MAISNHERVGKALDLVKDGLIPFVERELKSQHAQLWLEEAKAAVAPSQTHLFASEKTVRWDAASLLAVVWNQWNVVFRKTLGQAERTLVSELRDVRNRWAHQNPFSSDDAYRALDSASRLLTAVSAPQADEVEKMKMELLRVRFDEQMRTEKRKSAGTAIESQATGTLKPWREVITPHKDVATGRYQQAEFAADLWQVHIGEGSDEYKSLAEFFRRTFLTQSLQHLLVGAVQRLSGQQGDPVVQLQTNFGGGKTHSMLALYHLFSGTAPGDLLGVDAVLANAGVQKLPTAKRVVLVGNEISPGNPSTKSDGTVVRTLWGELAWQLGGKKAFDRIHADDERATSPGDTLRELFNEYGPCLVLIDEWVAYARQLHDASDLPAGSFETHFTFAQALTESAKLADRCLLAISLPASDTSGSPHAQANDVEVGGERGRAALDRLRNAVGRVEASWRPASAEEGFEIVRRRLFEPIVEKAQFVARDTVARAFQDLYRTQHREFPPECREADLEPCEEGGQVAVRRTITGNLWSQLDVLIDLLALVNFQFRLKAEVSKTVSAYSPLAVKEMVVNAIVHRDYDRKEPVRVLVEPRSIRVTSPGGLVDGVAAQVVGQSLQDAIADRTRSIKGYRNPAISDLFYGGGQMDRRGSGLSDMVLLTANNNGTVACGPTDDNRAFYVTLTARPEAVDEITNTALPDSDETVRYSSNLLSIEAMPSRVWHAGTTAASNRTLYRAALSLAIPPGHVHDRRFYSLYDLDAITREMSTPFDAGDVETVSFDELLALPNGDVIAQKLMHELLFAHLRARGLEIDYERRRAYFPLGDETERKVTSRAASRP